MIILASRSPRRAALLQQIGVSFTALAADIDETPLAGEAPEDFVYRMAVGKAQDIRARHPGDSVLGSDTVVVLDGQILGKPASREHALDMLLALSGREHRVLTGVALQHAQLEYALSDSRVFFSKLTRAQAEDYWESGEPADKAGAYAIQGHAAVFIRRIEGSYSGIMGLPLYETAQLLAKAATGK